MKPEVIRPNRLPLGRVLVILLVTWAVSTALRVVVALHDADQRAPVPRGPTCSTTTYYEAPQGGWSTP